MVLFWQVQFLVTSGCDHVDHVRTQMPYAVLVGIICIFCGTLPAAFGISPWLSLLVGTGVLIAIVLSIGKQPRETDEPGTETTDTATVA